MILTIFLKKWILGLIFGTTQIIRYKKGQAKSESSEDESNLSYQIEEKLDLCESSELHYIPSPPSQVNDGVMGIKNEELGTKHSSKNPSNSYTIDIDEQILLEKIELIQVVYPTYKLLGWYTTGTYIRPEHYQIHEFIERFKRDDKNQEYSHPLLMLLLDVETSSSFSNSSKSSDKISGQQYMTGCNMIQNENMKVVENADKDNKRMNNNVRVYEGIHHSNDQVASSFSFSSLDFTYATFASERISIDHVVRQQPKDPGISSTALYLSHIEMSLSTLVKKIQTIVSFLSTLSDAEKRKLPSTLIRQIVSLTTLLPSIENEIEEEKEKEHNAMRTIDSVPSARTNSSDHNTKIGLNTLKQGGDHLSRRFWSEYNDALATTLLASASKLTASVAEAMDLYEGIVGVVPSSLSNFSNETIDPTLTRAQQYSNFSQRVGFKYNTNLLPLSKSNMDTFGMDIESMNLLGQRNEEEEMTSVLSMDYALGSKKSGRKAAH